MACRHGRKSSRCKPFVIGSSERSRGQAGQQTAANTDRRRQRDRSAVEGAGGELPRPSEPVVAKLQPQAGHGQSLKDLRLSGQALMAKQASKRSLRLADACGLGAIVESADSTVSSESATLP